jgi:hypothetical protein
MFLTTTDFIKNSSNSAADRRWADQRYVIAFPAILPPRLPRFGAAHPGNVATPGDVEGNIPGVDCGAKPPLQTDRTSNNFRLTGVWCRSRPMPWPDNPGSTRQSVFINSK